MDADDPPVTAIFWQFDRETPVSENYKTSMDTDECFRVANILFAQIGELVAEVKQKIEMSITDVAIELKREDGSSLDIQCYGADIYDLVWWPGPEEVVRRGKAGFEAAPQLEVGTMRMLTYRYVTRGNLREEDA